jgi:chromosome segregation ATPase
MRGLLSAVKRVGMGAHAQKFQFTLTVVNIEFSKPAEEIVLPLNESAKDLRFGFVWKRGPRSASSGFHQWVDNSGSKVLRNCWGDSQTLMCTLYQDSKSPNFIEKASTLTFKVSVGDNEDEAKVFGVVNLNLAKYAGVENNFEDVLILTKCRDKNAKVKIVIRAKYLKGVPVDDDNTPSMVDKDDEEEASQTEEEKGNNEVKAGKSNFEPPKEDINPFDTPPSSAGNKIKEDPKVEILIAERDELLKQHQKLEKLYQTTKAKLAKKEEEAAAAVLMKTERDNAIERASKYSEDIKSIQAKLEQQEFDTNETILQLEKEKMALIKENTILTDEKSSNNVQAMKLQVSADRDIKTKDNAMEDYKKQVADLKAKLDKKESELRSLANLKQERDLAMSRLTKVQEELRQTKSQLNDVEAHGDENKSYKEKYEQLLNQYHKLEETSFKSEALLQADLKSKNETIDELNKDLATYSEKIEKLYLKASELASLKVDLDSSTQKNQQLSEELERQRLNYEIELGQHRNSYEKLMLEKDSWKDKFDAESSIRIQNAEKIVELTHLLDHLRQELETAKAEAERFREESSESHAECLALQKAYAQLKEELLFAGAELNQAQENNRISQITILQINQQIASLSQEKQEFQSELNKIEEKRINAERKKDAANKELERIQGMLGKMEVELVNSKIELVNTSDRMNSLEFENLQLKAAAEAQIMAQASRAGTIKKKK